MMTSYYLIYLNETNEKFKRSTPSAEEYSIYKKKEDVMVKKEEEEDKDKDKNITISPNPDISLFKEKEEEEEDNIKINLEHQDNNL